MEQGTMLADDVGRCDHEVRCRYYKTPTDYFAENRILHRDWKYPLSCNQNNHQWQQASRLQECQSTIIDRNVMERSLGNYNLNPLFRWFAKIVGNYEAERLFRLYHVGTSRKWGGATIFWQMDVNGIVRTGKIMGYDDSNGKRIKEPINHVSWAHSELRLSGFNLRQCLFGEHLLLRNPNKKVALVESEKSALVAKYFMPDFVWLATRGKNGCFNRQAMEVLRDREVMLIPDLKCEQDWQQRADKMLNDIAKSYAVSNVISARQSWQHHLPSLGNARHDNTK